MSRAIYLVANKHSEDLCANLVYSIRQSGCSLPLVLIPFGGQPITDKAILSEVQILEMSDFSEEAHRFIEELRSVLTCPEGFLRRFLAYFGPYDEFLYSDNDIVALLNWERLFDYLQEYDLVNADEEYITYGMFNFEKPDQIKAFFGHQSLESAITAGHFLSRKSEKLINDLQISLKWIKEHKEICKVHDQTLLHIAILMGHWNCLNLCKPPYNWMSSWMGDYKNTLELLQSIQTGRLISHLHYSGRSPICMDLPIDELLFSNLSNRQRNWNFLLALIKDLSQYNLIKSYYKRAIRKIKRILDKKIKYDFNCLHTFRR